MIESKSRKPTVIKMCKPKLIDSNSQLLATVSFTEYVTFFFSRDHLSSKVYHTILISFIFTPPPNTNITNFIYYLSLNYTYIFSEFLLISLNFLLNK